MSYLPPLKFAPCAQITPAVQPSLNVADLPSTAQLTMFLELAEQRSIKATAERLGRARSTVGRTLKMLEWHFGTRLMQRTRPQMTLTPQGRALLDMLQTHFVPLAAAIGQLRAAQPALRVWVADKGVTRILERVWAGYRRKDPRRIVWVNDARDADLRIDCVPEPASGDAEDAFLCADEWVAVSGAGWKGRTDLAPRDLLDYPIAFERAEDALAWQWFADADRPPNGQVMSRRAMARVLKHGQAVALVNASHHAEAI
ncbi:MAG: LysR family transcriptional regulator, partial [Pseudomonadota bacterium]